MGKILFERVQWSPRVSSATKSIVQLHRVQRSAVRARPAHCTCSTSPSHKIGAGSQSSSVLLLHIATTMYNSAPGYVVPPEFTLYRVAQW